MQKKQKVGKSCHSNVLQSGEKKWKRPQQGTLKGYFQKTNNTRYVAKAFLRKVISPKRNNMKGGQQEATYMGCEAKLRSKRGTDAIGTPTRQEKNGGREGTACGLHSKDGL